MKLGVLDHGCVILRNIAGPTRRANQPFDADDTDPANTARISFDNLDSGRTREDDLKLAAYLMKNRHTTPFEMVVVWLEMKLPIFVARQFVRHRTVSINEVSGRYVQLPKEWYIPRPEVIGIKAATNKQGRDLENTNPSREWFCNTLDNLCSESYFQYQLALERGIPAELARCFLHLNHYTRWVWKQDLHNMMHFLHLRQDSHAQYEARMYADAVHEILSTVLPETMKLYDKTYRNQGEAND